MKKILHIITSFVVASAFIMNVGVISAGCLDDGDDNPSTCMAEMGEALVLPAVFPTDDAGYPIVGVPVTYTWVAIPAELGNFIASGNSNWTDINSNGFSQATLNIFPSAPIGGSVRVVAEYAGGSAETIFSINARCDSEPILYFGISGVKDSDNDNWQYSTAELLQTCYPEYKLYGGIGERK